MIDEILNNFKNSQLHKEPFWYKSVSNIFPKNYYDRLVSDLPKISSYKPINKTGTVSKNYPDERFVFDLNYFLFCCLHCFFRLILPAGTFSG